MQPVSCQSTTKKEDLQIARHTAKNNFRILRRKTYFKKYLFFLGKWLEIFSLENISYENTFKKFLLF